jgi:Zn-dependent peptidase ImmA (M78 family)
MTYHPYRELAARPHLTLGLCPLPAGQDARWYPASQTILLGTHLGQSSRRSALAHELAHVDLGHCGLDGSQDAAKQEREADDLAARRLIGLDDLVEALLWSQDEHELAEWLWVDVDIIRARLTSLSDQERNEIEKRLWAQEASA